MGGKRGIVLGSLLVITGFISIVVFVNGTNYMTFIYLAGFCAFWISVCYREYFKHYQATYLEDHLLEH